MPFIFLPRITQMDRWLIILFPSKISLCVYVTFKRIAKRKVNDTTPQVKMKKIPSTFWRLSKSWKHFVLPIGKSTTKLFSEAKKNFVCNLRNILNNQKIKFACSGVDVHYVESRILTIFNFWKINCYNIFTYQPNKTI